MPDAKDDLLRPRPLEILALLPTGILASVLVGVGMNAINSWISSIYFRTVFLSWADRNNFETWVASINQGINEGLIIGLVSSLILVVVIGLISKLRCPFRLGLKVQMQIIAFSLCFGIIGGFNAVLIAHFWPRFYDNFQGLPSNTADALAFSWVAGSIYGVYSGSILSTIGVLSSFSRKWRQLEKQAQI